MRHFEKDYKLTGIYASVLSAIGWFILIGGIGVLLGEIIDPGFLYSIGFPYLISSRIEILLGSILVIIISCSFIITGQILRAIVDNTNANKEILWILKSRKGSSLLTNKQEDTTEDTTKAKEENNHFVRDGIKFKSRQDLEAYIESQRVADPFK